MAERRWTATELAERIAEAADVLRRLPEERVQGHFSTWPPYLHNPNEAYGWNPPRLRPIPPSPQTIDRMEAALGWLQWLEPDDAKLVWERASGTPWKVICWRFGVGRTTAWERWVMALCVIVLRLNGERVPGQPTRLRRLALGMRRT